MVEDGVSRKSESALRTSFATSGSTPVVVRSNWL